MYNRVEIAREFANAINSDKIIKIILFGSVARGDDHEESDIDILIISNHREDIEDIISEEIAWIMYDKQELISAHVINEDLFNKTKNFSFLTNVLKDGVQLDNEEVLAFIVKAESKLKHSKLYLKLKVMQIQLVYLIIQCFYALKRY